MIDRQNALKGLSAKILRDRPDAPIQLVLPPEAAASLAFIANDFAREVLPNSEEAERLIALAEVVALKLLDCVAARSPETAAASPIAEPQMLALAG